MDIFKFTPSSNPTTLDQGQQINGATKITWIERYSAPGEFIIQGKLSSGLLAVLPIGTLISHINTMEVMIVENHEIPETLNADSEISISGRSFVSFLENRAVGVNSARSGNLISPYVLDYDYTWAQIVKIINDHIVSPPCNANDAITNFSANHSMTGEGVRVTRPIPPGDLLKHVLDLLQVDNLGIRTIRRNPWSYPGGSSTASRINIYKGVDKTSKIMFSWFGGDISDMDYLFSQKNKKTSALVVGRFLNVMVDLSPTGYDRRIMTVDAQDIDQALTYPPDEGAVNAAITAMTTRGQQALAAQKDVSITQVNLLGNGNHQYRIDYNLGDLVSINGNFGEIAVRRVTEYAEIEDENGTSGHPTLTLPGE